MADVNKVPGANPVDPGRGPREPTKPGTDKFKDLMKVGDSEKRQKKGKKKQDESEEELKAELRSGAASPDKDAEAAKKAAKTPKIQQVGESEKKQPQQQKRSEEVEAIEAEGLATTSQMKVSQSRIETELTDLENKFENLTQGTAQAVPEEIMTKEEKVEEQMVVEEKEEVAEQVTFKQQSQKTQAQEESSQAVFPASSTLGPLFIAPPSNAPPAYATLSSEVLALFERMVGVISIMKESGVTETIIHLNTTEFANSRFAGSEIIIREYSTAPLAYNIEILGSPQNAAVFEQNVGALMHSFQTGNYNFRVNRIDTRLQGKEKPLFPPVTKVSEKKEKE